MKKIINDPQNLVDEMVQGMTRAYSSIVEQIPATNAIV
ncbi:MAG: dihydroxyacetone kinase, partial [Lactobacillus iners]|nr:dihydroxyacetone kinase [Lactobacillus iners]